jgi:outer membrane protein TolC
MKSNIVGDIQSQRDCVLQPKVASGELPWVFGWISGSTLKGLWPRAFAVETQGGSATTLSGLDMFLGYPRVASPSFVKSTTEGRQPWALWRNPFGILRLRRFPQICVFFAWIVLCSDLRAETLATARTTEPTIEFTTNVIDLPTVLRLAKAQNLDIQIAGERLNEAKANRDSATWGFFPWISPGAGFRRHEGRIQAVEGTVFDVDKQSYNVGGTITAQLDLGDAVYKSLAAKQLFKAAGQELKTQQQESASAAAQSYFELAKAKGLIGVLREALKVSEDYQKQIHEAVGVGVAFKGDELRVQTQTERIQISLRQALEQHRLAAARLAQTLHLDPSVDLTTEESELVPLALIDRQADLDRLVRQALRERPELKQSDSLIAAAREANTGAVYGPLIPTVSAQVFGGGLGGGPGNSTGNFGSSEDYYVGVGWRIGPGGLFDFTRQGATKARLESSKLSRAKLKDQIVGQVVESHARWRSLADQIDATKQNLATADETLRLSRERKELGVGIVLEDIQAQQELTRARGDYLTAVAEFDKAEYALARAVGDLSGNPTKPASGSLR